MELRRQQAVELPTTARCAVLGVTVVLALGAGAASAATPTAPVYDEHGNLIGTPFVPQQAGPTLTKDRAIAAALGNEKVAEWLDRYPRKGRVTDATYEADSSKCSTGALPARGRDLQRHWGRTAASFPIVSLLLK